MSIRQFPVFSLTNVTQPAAAKARRKGSGSASGASSTLPDLRRKPGNQSGEQVRIVRPGGIEAKRVPGRIGIGPPALAGEEQPGFAEAVARRDHLQPPRRRGLIVNQPEPGETAEQAGLGRTIERAAGIGGDCVEIVEQSDINRHALCPFAPPASIMTPFKQE